MLCANGAEFREYFSWGANPVLGFVTRTLMKEGPVFLVLVYLSLWTQAQYVVLFRKADSPASLSTCHRGVPWYIPLRSIKDEWTQQGTPSCPDSLAHPPHQASQQSGREQGTHEWFSTDALPSSVFELEYHQVDTSI
jgi:hypothetical protein